MQTDKHMSTITIIVHVDIVIMCGVMTYSCRKFGGNVKIGIGFVGSASTCLAMSYFCTISSPAIILTTVE